MGDAFAAPALGIALEQLADLEEQHHEHGFRKLGLRARQEAYAERAYGGDGHQEVLVEHVSFDYALRGLHEGLAAYKQIRDEIDQQELPGLHSAFLLNQHRGGKKHRRQSYQNNPALHSAIVVVVNLGGARLSCPPVVVCVILHGCLVLCRDLPVPATGGKVIPSPAQPGCKQRNVSGMRQVRPAKHLPYCMKFMEIQPARSARSSAETVSSIERYSVTAPVAQCWNRWFSESYSLTRLRLS